MSEYSGEKLEGPLIPLAQSPMGSDYDGIKIGEYVWNRNSMRWEKEKRKTVAVATEDLDKLIEAARAYLKVVAAIKVAESKSKPEYDWNKIINRTLHNNMDPIPYRNYSGYGFF